MSLIATKRLLESALLVLLVTTGCGGAITSTDEVGQTHQSLKGQGHPEAQSDSELAMVGLGRKLFREETFGGNGRTCETCHSLATGTVSPEELQARFQSNPNDPMFHPIDSQDGQGTNYEPILKDATVRVTLPLPPNVKLLNDPSATHITVRRGIPSTLDTPALDPVLMWDGREPSLESQAHNAVFGHAQGTRAPVQEELDAIAAFERSLFSSPALRKFALSGEAPALPEGTTESEKRGKTFFEPSGACGQCHGGPMLNEMTAQNQFGAPAGTRMGTAFISEFNNPGQPVFEFLITLPDGSQVVRASPDPGRFLITGRMEDFDFFKTSTLWNVKNTAPYFHDNSAKTLEEMMRHYTRGFAAIGTTLTPRDEADIIAYLKLL